MKPHMYYWVKDNLGREWRVLVEGEYESYPDGNNIVSELTAVEYYLNEFFFAGIKREEEVPPEILGFIESVLDDHKTYTEIQREYEEAVNAM